ncbi:MAG: hypothetical protein ACRD3J_21490 [Thermoanaerobaculia bacterium]
MERKNLLPKRVVNYINEIGVRSMDHLADHVQITPNAPDAGEGAESTAPNAVQALVGYWKSMTTEDKEEFVGRVAESVVEVVAASAALPLGLKREKKVIKATRRVVKREAKKIRRAAKPANDRVRPARPKATNKTAKPAKASAKSAAPAKRRARAKRTTRQKAG